MLNKLQSRTRALLFFFSVLFLCGIGLFIARQLDIADRDYYMPRSLCYRQNWILVWGGIITDFAVGVAYLLIPLLCVVIYYYEYTIRTDRLPSTTYRWPYRLMETIKSNREMNWGARVQHIGVYWIGFILFCGTGHLIDGFSMWVASPWAKLAINSGTAITSWAALVVTASHVPYFIAITQRVAAIWRNLPRTCDGGAAERRG